MTAAQPHSPPLAAALDAVSAHAEPCSPAPSPKNPAVVVSLDRLKWVVAIYDSLASDRDDWDGNRDLQEVGTLLEALKDWHRLVDGLPEDDLVPEELALRQLLEARP